jgi:hypothetical protein
MQKKQQFWYAVVQAMVGKLYVLSLFYIMYGVVFTLAATRRSDVTPSNDSARPSEEQLPTFVPTLTIPLEAYDGCSLDTGDGDVASCHRVREHHRAITHPAVHLPSVLEARSFDILPALDRIEDPNSGTPKQVA